MRQLRLLFTIGVALLAGVTSAFADDPYVSAPAYAKPVSDKTLLKPIVTTGQDVPLTGSGSADSFLFRGIPDGLGATANGETLTLLVNHEFRNTTGTPFGTLPNGARVSQLALGFAKGGEKASVWVQSGRYEFTHVYSGETLSEILSPPRGLSRLCAAFLADERVGFDRPILPRQPKPSRAARFSTSCGSRETSTTNPVLNCVVTISHVGQGFSPANRARKQA